MSERRGAQLYWAELQEGEEEKAERLLREELARRKWSGKGLAQRLKTDRRKVRIPLRFRNETTMTMETMEWIARRLVMGEWKHAEERAATGR